MNDFFAEWTKGGGPAFSVKATYGDTEAIFPGMKLRDWFAAHALTGIMASRREVYAWPNIHEDQAQAAAATAYEIADAMLAARSEGETK